MTQTRLKVSATLALFVLAIAGFAAENTKSTPAGQSVEPTTPALTASRQEASTGEALPADSPRADLDQPAAGVPARDESPVTDNDVLQGYLDAIFDEVEGDDGQWILVFDDVEMTLLSDEITNRVRVITPIVEADGLEPQELRVLLEANFDRALDAKYAIWRDIVWGVYLHPLQELSRDQLISALRQVATLRHTYGTTYSSMGLQFGGEEEFGP
jgi:hypothetical protein